jgi:hypothetical protein
LNNSNDLLFGQMVQATDSQIKAKLISDICHWKDTHEQASTLPYHLSCQLDQDERRSESLKFRINTPKELSKFSELKKILDADFASKSVRRRSEKALASYIRNKVAPITYDNRYIELADKLDDCRNSGVLGVRNDGRHLCMWDNKCRVSKLCPDESREEGQRLAARYIPAVEKFLKSSKSATFQYAVFTRPNVKIDDLYESKRSMYKEFAALLKRKSAISVKGSLVVQEDPLAAIDMNDDYSWNVHLNVLLLVDGRFDWKTIRDEWGGNIEFRSAKDMELATRKKLEKRGVKVRKLSTLDILAHAFVEIIKYSAKLVSSEEEKTYKGSKKVAPVMIDWPPLRFNEWWHANKGFRRTRSYGVLYRVGKPVAEDVMSEVTWIGRVSFDGTEYRCTIDLILADNSTFSDKEKKDFNRDYGIKYNPPPDRFNFLRSPLGLH